MEKEQCPHDYYLDPKDCPRRESCMYHNYMACPYIEPEKLVEPVAGEMELEHDSTSII